MRLLVCGDRNWTDADLIHLTLRKQSPKPEVLIHGAARGADRIAGAAAESLQIPTEAYPAEWEVYGKSAGPRRNRQMIVEGRPTLIWAFHDDIEASKGTKDMCKSARAVGLPVILFSHSNPLGGEYR